jgi:hypothetical protein
MDSEYGLEGAAANAIATSIGIVCWGLLIAGPLGYGPTF